MFCTECGAKNEEDAIFCNECGAKIVVGAPIAPVPDENGSGMPKMITCPNKHEFDPKQYPSCPYCTGKLPMPGKGQTGKGAAAPNPPAANNNPILQNAPAANNNPILQNAPAANNNPVVPNAPAANNNPILQNGAAANNTPAANAPAVASIPAAVEPVAVSAPPAVQPVKEEDFGKDPVVGWIVCTKGEGRGRDYRILAKNNRIGNGAASDICLKNNKAVDRENYATIAYYTKQNAFYLIPGDVAGGLKLNGNELEIPTEIHAKDVIAIGSCEYRFVSFCADDFRWED